MDTINLVFKLVNRWCDGIHRKAPIKLKYCIFQIDSPLT